ncbi:hypothetical protein EDC01DRAFT_480139 [Geopyxis carbonaria]|nr:hypothetical protein EDC01DRAFT_480139 [Geopyxis carbonaria]
MASSSSSIPKPQTSRSTMMSTSAPNLSAPPELTVPRGQPFSEAEREGLVALEPALSGAGDVEPVSTKTRRNRRRKRCRKYARARALARELDEFGADELEVLREKYPVLGVVTRRSDEDMPTEAPTAMVAADDPTTTTSEDTIDWGLPSGIASGPKPRWERKYLNEDSIY